MFLYRVRPGSSCGGVYDHHFALRESLVGVGVTFGRGCTSGHGVCGMARFSGRSFVATATFMLMTGVTVYLIRHVIGV